MCGRYAIYESKDLNKRFNLSTHPKIATENYNASPGQTLPAIIKTDKGNTEEQMRWGFVPAWTKDPTKTRAPINAKAETAFESRFWRDATLHSRCLIPARGFYEWKRYIDDDNKEKKQPYYIHLKNDDMFSFAGIYSTWKDVEGLPHKTFSIITTKPNNEMRPIHNRMPVILKPEQEELWLEPSMDENLLKELLQPYTNGGLDVYRVSSEVNSYRQNDKMLIAPISK